MLYFCQRKLIKLYDVIIHSKLFGYVLDLQRFEKILKENIEKGNISVNEKELIGTDNIIFEI